MKENWIKKQLVVISLAMLNALRAIKSVNDIGQVFVPIIVHETTPKIKDNVQTIFPNIVPKQDYDEVLPQIVIVLVELLKGVKPISCKWICKAKKDSKGNIEIYKAHLVANGFT
ncbi:hypothetical protein CR513_11971, partial [Mucuna pruriens]